MPNFTPDNKKIQIYLKIWELCPVGKPGMFDPRGRYKWNAWNEKKGGLTEPWYSLFKSCAKSTPFFWHWRTLLQPDCSPGYGHSCCAPKISWQYARICNAVCIIFRSTKHKYSKNLVWHLALDCFSAGMSKEEAMTKYIAYVSRLSRPPSHSQNKDWFTEYSNIPRAQSSRGSVESVGYYGNKCSMHHTDSWLEPVLPESFVA